MAAVERSGDGVPFVVVASDGTPVVEVVEFLVWLAARGRTSYTLRAYALGLADFVSWLERGSRGLDEVDLRMVEAYITAFRAGAKAGAVAPDPDLAGRLHPVTRKPYPAVERQPATVNHRLSVLSSFFSFLIERDAVSGSGRWQGRLNPVPQGGGGVSHGSPGRDAPRRGRRGELRLRTPRRLPRAVDASLAERLVAEARSWRDKALITLLWRTGQRIGDWSELHGCHGLLGLRQGEVDERSSTVLVRLKGARDEHRVLQLMEPEVRIAPVPVDRILGTEVFVPELQVVGIAVAQEAGTDVRPFWSAAAATNLAPSANDPVA